MAPTKDAPAAAASTDPLFPPGLINTANTCFFNSVMQCFIASTILQATIESPSLALDRPKSIDPARSPALADSQEGKDDSASMPISDAYIRFLELTWNHREVGDRRSLSPREVLTRLGAKYDQYLDFRQQDAHELYCHLLDAMHMEEFDIIKQRQPPPPKSSKKTRLTRLRPPADDDEKPIPEEERLRPFVDQVFGGKLASIVVCETCRHVSHTYEDFTDLSLSIKSDDKSRKRDRLKSLSQLFRIPARPPPRPSSVPHEQPLGLSDNEDNPNSSEAIPHSDVEGSTSSALIADRALMHGGSLLGGSNSEASKKLGHRLSIRWGKGRGRPTNDTPEKDTDRSAPQSEVEGKTGDESDADWEQVRRSLDVRRAATTAGHARTPRSHQASNQASDAESAQAPAVLSPRPSFAKRPNPLRLHSRSKGSSSTITPFRPMRDEAAYIRRILADTAPVAAIGPNGGNGLLRVANPAGTPSLGHPQTSWLKLGGSGHGMVDCLRQFTSVEVLEGDNAFACRSCWKIAHAARTRSGSDEDDEDEEDKPVQEKVQEKVDEKVDEKMDNDMVVVSRPASPTSPPEAPPMTRTDSGQSSMLSVPSRPPSVISQSAISLAESGDDLASSIISSPSTFPDKHTRAVRRSRSASPSSRLPGGFRMRVTTTSPDNSVSPTVTDPSTPLANALGNPFLASAMDRSPRRFHYPSPLSDMDSNLASEESDFNDSEAVSSTPGSEVGSRAPSPSPPESGPATPPEKPKPKPTIPRSQQVIHRRALKRYFIASAPPILVIHLKRFEQLSKSATPFFGNLKKIEDFVSFPEHLDMAPFMAPRREDYGVRRGRGRQPAPERREDEPLMYRLYGVVVHIGSMLGGHYIAYTALPSHHPEASPADKPAANDSTSPDKANGNGFHHNHHTHKKPERQWCYISDTTVRLVSIDEVLKAKAYLCFYERMYT